MLIHGKQSRPSVVGTPSGLLRAKALPWSDWYSYCYPSSSCTTPRLWVLPREHQVRFVDAAGRCKDVEAASGHGDQSLEGVLDETLC